MPKVKTFNQKFCKTFTQKKKIIIRVGAVFLQKQLFLYSILLCIKKLYKSIPVATFVSGIKIFATQAAHTKNGFYVDQVRLNMLLHCKKSQEWTNALKIEGNAYGHLK